MFFCFVMFFAFFFVSFKQNILHSNRGHSSKKNKGLMSVHVGVC